MNLKWITTILAILLAASPVFAADTPALKTKKDLISYAVGVEVARNFKRQDIEFDVDLMIKGLKDELGGKKLLLTDRQIRGVMNSLQAEVRRKMAASRQRALIENRKKGTAFLAKNKTREGVVTLPGGVQYEVLKKGTGGKPGDKDTVVCRYRGTLINGTEFDETLPDKPAVLNVSKLIPGWRQALKLMPVGSKWRIFIPSELAYGEKGMGAEIGPNETLIFDVELLKIQ